MSLSILNLTLRSQCCCFTLLCASQTYYNDCAMDNWLMAIHQTDIFLYSTIVNRGEWLWNPTNFFVVCFCSLFWPWPCTKHNSCLLRTEELTNRNVLVTLFMLSVWEQNKRLCTVVDYKLNLGIFVCSFDVCRTSKPVPSINYGTISFNLQIYLKETNILKTREDGFSSQFLISTWLTKLAPGKSNFLELWHSGTQQNTWKLTVFKVVFRPKYCRSAWLSSETLFLVELKLCFC